jgi:hypothetical protein
VGPRAGLDDVYVVQDLSPPALELRSLGRPARSQSLHRLPYPGSPNLKIIQYLKICKLNIYTNQIYFLRHVLKFAYREF